MLPSEPRAAAAATDAAPSSSDLPELVLSLPIRFRWNYLERDQSVAGHARHCQQCEFMAKRQLLKIASAALAADVGRIHRFFSRVAAAEGRAEAALQGGPREELRLARRLEGLMSHALDSRPAAHTALADVARAVVRAGPGAAEGPAA